MEIKWTIYKSSRKEEGEKKIDELNKKVLAIISKHVGNGITTSTELNEGGKMLFGKRFLGVFPSDLMPKKIKNNEMFIANLDGKDKPGSHWIAIGKKSGKTIVYDSFGRDVLPAHLKQNYGKVYRTDPDAEQNFKESNCGARALSWLYILDRLGVKIARAI